MKQTMKFLIVSTMFLFATANAGDCIVEGETIPKCYVKAGTNGEQPNLLIQWSMPTEREDGTTLLLSEIKKVRTYFKYPNGNWNHQSVYDGDTSLFIYRPAAQYAIRLTAFDTSSPEKESKPTPDVIVTTSDAIDPPVDIPVEVSHPVMPSGTVIRVIITFK